MTADLIEERHQRLTKKLGLLYEQYDLETHVEEKLRLESSISATERELQDLEPTSVQKPHSESVHIDRLPTVSGEFFGREDELQLLNDALVNDTTNIIQFIAPGGTGKTKMLRYLAGSASP